MPKKINEIQKLNLELIKKIRFNNFDGEHVYKLLMKHKDLWEAVIADRTYYKSFEKGIDAINGCDLIKLRDLPNNYWNVDTLFILTKKKNNEKLLLVVHEMWADSIEWLTDKEASEMMGAYPSPGKVLTLWWD